MMVASKDSFYYFTTHIYYLPLPRPLSHAHAEAQSLPAGGSAARFGAGLFESNLGRPKVTGQ
jgi:hypothetical protein